MWARFVNIAVGIWLMAAPSVLSYGGAARINDVVVGPLMVSFATIAIWEATRPLRWLNFALGTWLLLAAWILGYPDWIGTLNVLVAGLVAMAASLVRGPMREQFGAGWRELMRA